MLSSTSQAKLKFLLDENVHSGLFSFLVKSGHDVKSSPKSIKNGKVFELTIEEQRILITRDADFLYTPLYPLYKHFGIILLRIPPGDLEAQKKGVSRLLKRFSKAEEYKRKVVLLHSAEKFEFL